MVYCVLQPQITSPDMYEGLAVVWLSRLYLMKTLTTKTTTTKNTPITWSAVIWLSDVVAINLTVSLTPIDSNSTRRWLPDDSCGSGRRSLMLGY